ncbi:error-prone DNA polymerase [Chelativorans sp. Marseille-P2723]|uniref:error-prone DNA polymerase n=1 Tax=Chelativorans sp. Marseille-P2723 TaxID=2709133 RepID=UPI00156E9474|nr:error-prone DNA polymerase [Chelativorans sp. Marseille-P2723]
MNTVPAYAEFAVQSNFSFLRGASHPEELAVTAKLYGFRALGLADRNTVAGVVRAWSQAKVEGLAYHPGCRLVFSDGTPDILAYPRDRQGWGHLCRMLTQANLREESQKGAPVLFAADLIEWGDRMSLAILPRLERSSQETLTFTKRLEDRFGNAVRLAVAASYSGDDRFRLAQASAIAEAAGIRLMAVNDVLYHAKGRRSLQDVLTAIRMNVPVAQAGFALEANAERHMKPPDEMARLFRHYPDALAETIRFGQELSFSLGELEYNYPDEPTESGLPPQEELERLTWEGARSRFPDGMPPKVEAIIRHELDTVSELGYARYFLTVYDIMNFARSRGILCQGRGSAANSLICYCLRITEIGPDIIDTLFERFISRERNEPPDIDVDFEHERRDEVIAYIYEKYSLKCTALAASVVTYRGRSALRQVAKALGFSEDAMSALSGSVWGTSSARLGETETRAAGLDGLDARTKHLIDKANEILGFPRHLSQHVGGFVITRDRLDEIVPIVKTAMDERKMIEWDKDDLDAVKMLKVDVLALGMLSCLRRSLELLKEHYDVRDDYGRPLELATIPAEDSRVYDMICRADTVGVFQIESRAQMSMLPRLKPREFYDLVIEVAIVRPGPIQGDMVHPYLRRRKGIEKPEYIRPELEAILKKTLGVPLFQEQAMRIAIEAGGFSAGEADQLRRAMATFRRTGTISNYRQRMVEGMVAKGYPEEFARRCFRQIEGFGEYGFPESHAAAFAHLVYASCWFKTFYPDVFCAAILNSQPMGFYAPAQLVRDAIEHGVEVRSVDINFSEWDCTLEKASFAPAQVAKKHAQMRTVIKTRHAVRLGFRQIKGLSEDDMERLVQKRGAGYDSVRDLWLRSGLSKSVITRLAEADAFRSLGLDRRAALWAVHALEGTGSQRLPLLDKPHLGLFEHEPEMRLAPMPLGSHVVQDYRAMGLSLKAHPVSFLRETLDAEGVLANECLAELADGSRVSIAGLVLIRQRPDTSKGVIFMTLEDETGTSNAIVWNKVFERFRPQVLGARFARITGRLQKASDVIHVVAERIDDLSSRLDTLLREEPAIAMDASDKAEPAAGLPARSVPLDGSRQASEARASAASVMPKGRNFH